MRLGAICTYYMGITSSQVLSFFKINNRASFGV
jgi:hypothetical protein